MHAVLKLATAAVAMIAACTGSALAYTPHGALGQGRMGNLPPLAYQLFCLQNPHECTASGKASLRLDGSLLKKLSAVNIAVNNRMTPRDDPSGTDVWTVGSTAGDCEDYALNKRHQLVAMGIAASALRMAVVRTASGSGHAVLIVHTARGDYVLDNLTNAIRPLRRSGLHVVAMASADPHYWNS